MNSKLSLIQFQLDELIQGMKQLEDRISEQIQQLYSHVDGFIHLHKTLDVELVALMSKFVRLEQKVDNLSLEVNRPD